MKTGVEYLIEMIKLNSKEFYAMLFEDKVFEKAKEQETIEYALFLRWILKHYSTKITDEGMFGWVNSMGEDSDIEDIVKHYKSDNQ